MTLVDTNIIVDLFTRDPAWFDWSTESLEICAAAGPILINEIIYAELAVRSKSATGLDDALADLVIGFVAISKQVSFMAGKIFGRYRDAGGGHSSLLPDFFIGAQAHVLRCPILTRDVRRYRTYFPDVVLITP